MKSNRIFINIFSNWANFLILIIVGFFLTPFFIHKLGDEEYGIWILILSVVGYMELLNLGIYTGVVRYISKYIETRDQKKANEIFNTAFFLFSCLALIITLMIIIVAMYFPYFFKFEGNPVYKIIVIIVGLNIAFEFIFYTFSAVLAGKQKFLEVNIIESLIFLIRTVLVVVYLMAGYKLLAIAIIQVGANLIKGLILSLYSLKITPELSFHLKSVNKATLKTIFNYTVYNFFINISNKVSSTGSIVIIGYFLSTGAVTFYAIANNLINYLHTLIMQMQRVLIPRFSQLEAQNNHKKIREFYLSFTRYTLIITIPIVYIFVSYGDSFIALWIGEKYAELSGAILIVLAIGKLFHVSQLTAETALKGISKHKNLSFIKLLESITVLILSVILVRKYDLIGVAYANTIPMILFNLIIIPIYVCYLLEISVVRYYMQYILKNCIAIIPLLLIFYLIDYPVNSFAKLGLLSVVVAVVFFALSFLLILELREKKIIYEFFKIRK